MIFLQETHCHNRSKESDGQSILGWGTNNSEGVTILFNRRHSYNFDIIERDMSGQIIAIDLRLHNNVCRLIIIACW